MEEYFYNEGHRLMQNDFIRQYQSRLNIIREERSEPWLKLATDGIYGRNTRDVVKEFQKKYCQPANGRMDERTQREITNITNQCVIQREKSTMRRSKPKVDLTVNSKQYNYYANPSVVCPMTACATIKPVSSPPPVAASIAPETYEEKGIWDKFKEMAEQQWNSIGADIRSLLDVLRKTRPSKLVGVLIDRLRVLVPKIGVFVEKAKSLLSDGLGRLLNNKQLQSIIQKVKAKGKGFVTAIKKNPNAAAGLAKTKSFVKSNAIGIVFAIVPMIINLFKWITCDDSESAQCEKEFWKSFRSFLGALLIMVGIEVVAGALVAAGIVGGSAMIVAAIIGLVVAIIDIIVMCCNDEHKGLSDYLGDLMNYIFEGLTETGESLGEWFFEVTHPNVPKSYTVYELELMGMGPDGLPSASGHAR
jgi:hypothetical protein